MGLLSKIALALVGLLFITVAGLCVWFFAYMRHLPDISYLAQFAPNDESEITDPCLAGPSVAIPLSRIGEPLRNALTVAEPVRSMADQIAGRLMCNSGFSNGRYAFDTFLLSWEIRKRFSDEQIITIYANRAYFGPGATGIENASIKLYQKKPDTLSTGEAALLAGLLRAPQYLSPLEYPERALRRRNQVLDAMVASGKLSAAEAAKAEAVLLEKNLKGAAIHKDSDALLEPIKQPPPDTPESIAKAMFPNAPDKTLNIECFRSLTPEMSMYKVVQKCGRPDGEFGSGIYIFVWKLADGSSVSIGTPYLDRIGDVRIADASGRIISLFPKK
jgi:hypothetical protein